MRIFIFLLALLTSFLGRPSDLFGAEENATNVQETRASTSDDEAFQKALKGTKAPWLDRDASSVKYLPQEPSPERNFPYLTPKISVGDLSWTAILVKMIFWIIVAVVFGVVAFILIRYALVLWKNRENSQKWKDAIDRERRLETLAPEARARFDDLLEAAKDALARQNYRDALIFYFSWLLVELDKREFVFLGRGKTNLEYLRELKGVEPVSTIYRATMREFERVYYGGRPIAREEFDDVWNLREAFESTMREKDAAIAEAKANRANAPNVARVLLIGALVLAGLAPGCSRREKTWKELYSAPSYEQYARDKSVNGIGAFQSYCRSKFGQIATPNQPFNADKTNTIVVFQQDGWRSDGWDFDPWYSDKSNRAKRLETLRKYAECGDDDWKRLARPSAFYICSDEIEEWLKAKEGRTFVWVLPGHSYELEYWKASRARLAKEAPGYLKECDEQIEELERLEDASKAVLAQRLRKLREIAKKQLLAEQAKSRKEDETTSEFTEEPPTDAPEEPIQPELSLFDDGAVDEIDFRDDPFYGSFEWEEGEGVRSKQYFVDTGANAVEPRVEPFSGDASWTKNLPKERTSTETRRLEAQDSLETLLALGDCALVQRLHVGNSQILVVNSTSFLSNFGLLETTNQTIAARLTDEFSKEGKIAFCYGNFAGFGRKEATWDVERSEFSLTKISPFTIFIWHVVALTMFVFFYFFPIMGRPKRMRRERVEDFGLHIDATARLLKRSDGVDWVREHIDAFRKSERPNEKQS